MKTLSFLFILALASCGNPHLTAIDGVGSKNVPVIGTPEDLKAKGIRTDDGLSLKTEEESISGFIELQNLDLDKTWIMAFEFEKGENFRFKGETFPGTNGTCRNDIKGTENCKLEVEFHSLEAGLYADNLKITYATENNPEEKRHISYSLRGERTKKIPEAVSSVIMKTISQADKLDFGKSFLKDSVNGKVVVKNIGDVDVRMDINLEKNDHIHLSSGSCKETLAPGKDCLLDVSFAADSVGLYQDNILLTHSPVVGGKIQSLKFPVLGEKIPNKKQGPLVASEVFSNVIDFGKVKLGIEVKKQIEIQNLGETVYNLKEIIFTKNNVFNYSAGNFPGLKGTCGDVILPGSCLIELTFRPKELKRDEGNFKLITKEGDAVELKLIGEGKEEKKCESYNEYLIIPEKSYPSSLVQFPYYKSHSRTTAKLSHLYGLEVNSYVKSLDTYTVKDGMVYITFKLPQMEGEIINMNFGVHVLKVIQDNFKDTESLCLSSKNVRKCSGHEFSLAAWQTLKHPQFWDIYPHPVSERYERQFAAGEYKCGSFDCMNLNTQYELSDIFELSSEEMAKIRKEGVFTLIFSDDTRMLKMPRIAVKTKVMVSCE